MAILVTGGAGYIGTHTVVELLESGKEVVIVDNLSNSSMESIRRVVKITEETPAFYLVDLLDKPALEHVFETHPIETVIHFAALKAVGESVAEPLRYYHNNLIGTLNLLEVMQAAGTKDLVFSSSATVYSPQATPPLKEGDPTGPINPYGQTKLMIEQMLTDLCNAEPDWKVALLRYFNPIGAHISGLIGEDPNGIPNNLVPYIAQTAVGKRGKLGVFGDDYDTPDGTGIRDYLHVVDLAKAHVAALQHLPQQEGARIYNLGTGTGYSVFEVLHAFEKACGKQIPYEILPRRAGDVAVNFADPSRAEKELGWKAEKTLDEMCADTWRWQSMNPGGFGKGE